MTSGLLRYSLTDSPAGTTMPPSVVPSARTGRNSVYSGAGGAGPPGACGSQSSGRYSNVHWNWPAIARILWSGAADTASTVFSVLHDTTNRSATMIVGTTVQTISATALPWVCGGSS